jgi:hypothetical protein
VTRALLDYTPELGALDRSNRSTEATLEDALMRKALVSVIALLATACGNKPSSPAANHPVATAAATEAAAPATPSAAPAVEQTTTPPAKAAANTKKTVRNVHVAKTAPRETTPQKLPVSEGVRRDGPG